MKIDVHHAVFFIPAGGVLIPACGDGNPRVRRWQSPRAAFEIPAGGVFSEALESP